MSNPLRINLVIERQNDNESFAEAFDIVKIQRIGEFTYIFQTEPNKNIPQLIGDGAGAPLTQMETLERIKTFFTK